MNSEERPDVIIAKQRWSFGSVPFSSHDDNVEYSRPISKTDKMVYF